MADLLGDLRLGHVLDEAQPQDQPLAVVELQRSPSVGEIAAKLEIEPAEVLEVLEANHNRRPLSLDRPVGGEDDESPASA